MSLYRVTDPAGAVHERRSGRVYTHAVIRRNIRRGPADGYFVSWASSRDLAEREARVRTRDRDYIDVVPVAALSGEGA